MNRSMEITPALNTRKQNRTKWLFTLCWIQYTVIFWMTVIMNRVSFMNYVTPYIFPVMLIITLCIWLNNADFTLDLTNFAVITAALALWFLSRAMHPELQIYFDDNAQTCLEAFLMIYVGKSVFRGGIDEDYFSLLTTLSLIGVLFTALYFGYGAISGRGMEDEYMTIAYRTLPSTLCLAAAFLRKINFRNTASFVFAVLLQFFMGTRGAILAVIVFVVLYLFLFAKRKTFWIALVCALLYIVLDEVFGISIRLLEGLANIGSSLNLSTRIFDSILDATIADDNGRDVIYETAFGRVQDNIWLGEGLFADRSYLSGKLAGSYAHNLFIEMWSNFGLIPTVLILAALLISTIRKLICRAFSSEARILLCIGASAALTQLMVSSSYLINPTFWLFVGMLWGINRYLPRYTEESMMVTVQEKQELPSIEE